MTNSLSISERLDANGVGLVVAGELDAMTTNAFSARLDEVVRDRVGDVVIDLTSVAFVDSTTLHILLNAQRRLTRQGRRLAVLCSSGPVLRVFELARLVDTLGVVAPDHPAA